MSILIKGMEMPKNCKECPFYWEQCGVDPEAVEESYRTEDERHPDCPLIHVPPHGRLIDADALIAKCGGWYTEEGTDIGFIGSVKQLLDEEAPTIIPAEGKCDIAFQNGAGCSDCDDYWECNQRLEQFFRAEQAEEGET